MSNNNKLEDGLQHPSVDVDAFATAELNEGMTLTFDLSPPTSNQIISKDYCLFPVSFIEIAQVVHEICCSQDLNLTA